ncbi:MAG TPA: protein-glutamate O-methyltransferase CheR [Thermodesulfovibrionales bacterium]|nr:protein-glutamate O-methyltransferase CheR [Thermodesulfovibrionales bacterium]
MESVKGAGAGELIMTEKEYRLFIDLIEKEVGIVMKGDKRVTLQAKLSHRLAILGLSSYGDYYNAIISEPSKEELHSFISHITNNETYFMREIARFALFGGLLSEMKRCKLRENRNDITILSAGCSSGEEVYTLNIMLMESGLFAWGWDVNLFGIDVNNNALKKARNAAYTRNSFRLLDGNEEFRQKYFDRKDDSYILKLPYRSRVQFRHGNILHPESFGGMGTFDAIFCRNVFIYMSDEAIQRITEHFYRHLADDGYLFIGSSESLLSKSQFFVPEYRDGVIVYRKKPSSGARSCPKIII